MDRKALTGNGSPEQIIEFGQLFKSEAISLKKADYKQDLQLLNITKINLDEDIGAEYLLFIGTGYANSNFYVIDDDYSIIYEEYLWLHNEHPQLKIYNSSDQYKLFGFRYLYGRGSGRWLFSNKVFRVAADKVSLVLEFVDNSNDTWNFEGINGWIETENIQEYGGDLIVEYSYDFYVSPGLLEQLGISHEEDSYSLAKGEDITIIYSYDPVRNQMKFNEREITSEMIDLFFQPTNDSLFLQVFRNELDKKMKNGTALDKRLIEYLRNKDY